MRYLTIWCHCSLLVVILALLCLPKSAHFPPDPSWSIPRNYSARADIVPHFFPVKKGRDRSFVCQEQADPVRCYGPAQIRQAYAVQPLLDQGITGKGQTIVIVNAFDSPHLHKDLHAFDQFFGLPDPKVRVFYPGGRAPFNRHSPEQVSWSGEIMLDVEWAHAIAPGADIALVLAKSGDDKDMISALRYAVDRNLGDVIAMSFGENEHCMDPKRGPELHRVFEAATRKKITLVAASGDNGAATPACDNKQGYRQAVSTPANDPLVTAVGGTRLTADLQTGAYQDETAWNEANVHLASGGGFSTLVHRPRYQADVPGIGRWRGLPDVAYNAASDGGFLVIWSDGPRGANDRTFYIYSGTSAGTPQWAAIVVLANQMAGKRLGSLNEALYDIGQSALYNQAFHDIQSGNNSVTLGGPHNKATKFKGYEARSGWDAVTGWGTPLVSQLVPILVAADRDHR